MFRRFAEGFHIKLCHTPFEVYEAVEQIVLTFQVLLCDDDDDDDATVLDLFYCKPT